MPRIACAAHRTDVGMGKGVGREGGEGGRAEGAHVLYLMLVCPGRREALARLPAAARSKHGWPVFMHREWTVGGGSLQQGQRKEEALAGANSAAAATRQRATSWTWH